MPVSLQSDASSSPSGARTSTTTNLPYVFDNHFPLKIQNQSRNVCFAIASDLLLFIVRGGIFQTPSGALKDAEETYPFFTDYLSLVLLAGCSDSLIKYNKS